MMLGSWAISPRMCDRLEPVEVLVVIGLIFGWIRHMVNQSGGLLFLRYVSGS